MKLSKKYKFVLPALTITPVIAIAGISTACAKAAEDQGIDATKVTVKLNDQELKDKTEFDIKTVKKLQLKATVEPAQANQDVTFEIIDQEGTGNIACSQAGIIYTNDCVGSITIRAVSKAKNKLASDPIELVFWNSDTLNFYITKEDEIDVAYCTCSDDYINTLEELVIPSKVVIKDKEYPVAGVGYGAFSGCSTLWYARFPMASENFVYLCANSFYQCSSLKNVVIPDSVLSLDYGCFSNCTSLQSVELGKSLQFISNAVFLSCSNLESINFPKSLTYIGAEAFRLCVKLGNVTIPASVKTIGESAFANCWRSHVYVDSDSEYFYSDKYALYNKKKTRLLQCQYDYVPSTNEAVFEIDKNIEKIDARAFEYCERIQWINFPEDSKCTSIGEYCFVLCTNLTHCVLPKNITEIKSNTFAYCWNLVEMEIPESVSLIQKYAFYGCDNLEKVNFVGESNEAITWTVANISSQPKMSKSINVHWYEKLEEEEPYYTNEVQKTLNAFYLKSVGYIEDPEDPESEWVGGYSNCVWMKNNIELAHIEPLGTDVVYDAENNPTEVNLGSTSITLNIIFGKTYTEATAEYTLDMYDQTGQSVCTEPVKLWSEQLGSKAFTLKFKERFKNATYLTIVISKTA